MDGSILSSSRSQLGKAAARSCRATCCSSWFSVALCADAPPRPFVVATSAILSAATVTKLSLNRRVSQNAKVMPCASTQLRRTRSSMGTYSAVKVLIWRRVGCFLRFSVCTVPLSSPRRGRGHRAIEHLSRAYQLSRKPKKVSLNEQGAISGPLSHRVLISPMITASATENRLGPRLQKLHRPLSTGTRRRLAGLCRWSFHQTTPKTHRLHSPPLRVLAVLV